MRLVLRSLRIRVSIENLFDERFIILGIINFKIYNQEHDANIQFYASRNLSHLVDRDISLD